MKRVLFISQYFYPEVFRGNDIAFDMAKRGYKVTVLCGTPNYPQGTFYNGYSWLKNNKETIDGVDIIRLPIIPRGKGSPILLLLNYFSYMIVASIMAFLFALFKEKYDIVFVQQLSPVMISVPGVLYKKITKVPLYTWVLDLWPESLSSAGGIRNKYILHFFEWFARLEYKCSTKILVSSKGFIKSICEKGDYSNKIIYYPNWAEDVFTSNLQAQTYTLSNLPDGFKIMFAGNVGEAQDFDHIMDTALLLKDEKQIHFIIVGDGRKRKWVDEYVFNHQLKDTVHVLGRYPIEMMPSFFEKADIMLVTLKNELIFNLTAPAKLQAYMSSRKPILGMLSGEGNLLIKEAKCGISVNASDSKALAKAILEISKMDKSVLTKWGNNGFVYCEKKFKKDKCLNHLYEIIEESFNVK